MQPFVRTAFLWAFSAYFGCVTLVGQGWHCFHNHPPLACQAAVGSDCHAEHQPACSAHDHRHDATHGEATPEFDGASLQSVEHDHDCPICRFFSHSPWAAKASPILTSALVCQLERPASRVLLPTFVGTYQSRGPPPRVTIV